ncbi:pyruvate decarboxylase [Lophium mytilinum]|uniref:Pyruvate decarboxylase n=1 Tax=Lophium mytilinum TaxID=390894 RepID=A0A6A6R1U8_9PEZI|nr:pyruvate decarboxylase [Lophium mytilinum]
MATVLLAEYLFTRLHQLSVGSIHGVPGDYNLELLDYVAPNGLCWVGNVNELNAGYAADGYARIKGIGALITTFGVGELSAINAIAGAYAERAPIIHIVGTPNRATQDARLLVHHTFNDGNYRRFGQMHAHVTVAQTSLRDPSTSPEQIDHVLTQCLLHSRPVYIEVPVDLVSAPVLAARLRCPIAIPDASPNPTWDKALTKVLDIIYAAKQPIILADGESRALDIVEDVQALIKSTNWPSWTTPFGKGLFDETLPNFHGIYKGTFDDPASRDFFNQADLILCFGPHWSSTNTYDYSTIPKTDASICFTDTEIKIGDQILRDIPARLAVRQLLQKLNLSKIERYDSVNQSDLLSPNRRPLTFSDVAPQEPITHANLWNIFSGYLHPDDIILGETGTAGHGVRELVLPPRARLFAPATWLSIGYMLPAAQGAALAQRELQQARSRDDVLTPETKSGRTILFIGDGSFQMTAQELSTIIRHNLNVVVFLLNNDGYTIERCLHGLHEEYNDVARWRYMRAPGFFGAEDGAFTAAVGTWGELEEALNDERLMGGKGLRMVELRMGREDVPRGALVACLERERRRVEGVVTNGKERK